MGKKTAFITGVTGQDGSYLCEFLLEKGYEVHGLVKSLDTLKTGNIGHLVANRDLLNKSLFIHHGSLEETELLSTIIAKTKPDELYHLAGQSSPRVSLEFPEMTMEIVGMATLRLLEIIRNLENPPKFLNAASSEIFGSPLQSPQDESTPVNPETPYGVAKAIGFQLCSVYRKAHSIFACSAILYNHESPRRGGEFVTMKVARAVAAIKKGIQRELVLGNLSGRRDWGWAPDYVEGMWMMMQQDVADDFILATGRTHSVQDLVEFAFDAAGLNWRDFVKSDPGLLTKIEPLAPCGNATKANEILGWSSQSILKDIMEKMVASEIDRIEN